MIYFTITIHSGLLPTCSPYSSQIIFKISNQNKSDYTDPHKNAFNDFL